MRVSQRMTCTNAPKPLRFNHEKTESTVTISMRSEKRFSVRWSSKVMFAAVAPERRGA